MIGGRPLLSGIGVPQRVCWLERHKDEEPAMARLARSDWIYARPSVWPLQEIFEKSFSWRSCRVQANGFDVCSLQANKLEPPGQPARRKSPADSVQEAIEQLVPLPQPKGARTELPKRFWLRIALAPISLVISILLVRTM